MNKLNMRKNKYGGYLFTFCGLDGSGKTTMINKLAVELGEKHDVFLTKQPTNAVRKSEIFRNYMDCPNHDAYDYKSLSLLAASDRIQHSNRVIEPALRKGQIVLSDRYFYSCLANLRARGYKDDKWIYEVAESIVMPDIAFFLDVPVSMAVDRVRQRPEERGRYIDIYLQYELRKEYVEICKRNNGVIIDTELSEEECYAKIMSEIERVMDT